MRAILFVLIGLLGTELHFLPAEPARLGESQLRPNEIEIAIRRGDRVQLFCRIGAVTAQVEAEALQDGRVGAEIRVRNLQNGRVHRARVTAPGEVEVLP